MPPSPLPLTRLVWIEVVSAAAADLASDLAARWAAALPAGVTLTPHVEADGRRLLLLERWDDGGAVAPWTESEAHARLTAWLDTHGARTASSRWNELPPPALPQAPSAPR